jgi:hypothetical protein
LIEFVVYADDLDPSRTHHYVTASLPANCSLQIAHCSLQIANCSLLLVAAMTTTADYGYGDATPDSSRYEYGDAAPDSSVPGPGPGSLPVGGADYNAGVSTSLGADADADAVPMAMAMAEDSYGYGDATSDRRARAPTVDKYGYGDDAMPDSTSNVADMYGYGEVPPIDPSKYGYGHTAAESQSNPHGYGDDHHSKKRNNNKYGYRNGATSANPNPYGYGDDTHSQGGTNLVDASKYGYGDDKINNDTNGKYGYGEYSADYNDAEKLSSKEYRKSGGRQRHATNTRDGVLPGTGDLGWDTGSVHSTKTAESYGESGYRSADSGSDCNGGGEPQQRQRYRRRGSVTKYSLEATHSVRQQYDADGLPLPPPATTEGEATGAGDAMQSDAFDNHNHSRNHLPPQKSTSAMTVSSDDEYGASASAGAATGNAIDDDDANMSIDSGDEGSGQKKTKRHRFKAKKFGRIVKKGVKAIGRRRASMAY